MARIRPPDGATLGDHIDWALHRPEMAMGMGALSSATYDNTRLAVREREAARYVIAQLNDCAVCKDTRAAAGSSAGADEGFYAQVVDWRTATGLTERERLAAEFAERFVLDHHTVETSGFLDRLREHFADGEIADLTICCGTFLGLGRAMAVMGVAAPPERLLV